jgi:hypothetical protein
MATARRLHSAPRQSGSTLDGAMASELTGRSQSAWNQVDSRKNRFAPLSRSAGQQPAAAGLRPSGNELAHRIRAGLGLPSRPVPPLGEGDLVRGMSEGGG